MFQGFRKGVPQDEAKRNKGVRLSRDHLVPMSSELQKPFEVQISKAISQGTVFVSLHLAHHTNRSPMSGETNPDERGFVAR